MNREIKPELQNLLALYGDTVESSAAHTGAENETLFLEYDIIKHWRPVTNLKGVQR